VLGKTNSQRINTLVTDIVVHSAASMEHAEKDQPLIVMSNTVMEAANELRDVLFERVYRASLKTEEVMKAHATILLIYTYFMQHPDKLPPEYNRKTDGIERRITDYIAGMTDSYAMLVAERLGKAQVP